MSPERFAVTPHLLDPTRRWQCPSCGLQHVTREPRPHTPLHACKAHAGFAMPYAPVHGSELRKNTVVHRVVERGDTTNGDKVRTDANGRAVMAVLTERADGYDSHVYAPTAEAHLKEIR